MFQKIFKRTRNHEEEEKSFVDHLEDLRWVLVKSVAAIFISAIASFFYVEKIFDTVVLAPAHNDFITYQLLCRLGHALNTPSLCLENLDLHLQSTEMSSQFMMSFKIAFTLGFIFSFPYLVSVLWAFISPALKDKEKHMVRFIVFWISLLFFLGISFGYFIITPYTVHFFGTYQLSPMIQNNFLLTDYIETILQLVVGTGIVFQLPLCIYFLVKLGILNARILQNNRKYALVIVLIVAAVITPPDVMSQLIVTIPLWILYEISILVAVKIEKHDKSQ